MSKTDFSPLLAYNKKFDFKELRFPLYGSPKIDGIRTIMKDGKALTRNLKSIPNVYTRELLEKTFGLDNTDGEIIVGTNTDEGLFQATSSGIMSHDGTPSFTYLLFDIINNDKIFKYRYAYLQELYNELLMKFPYIQLLDQVLIYNLDEMYALEDKYVNLGYEGLILRSPNGLYKHGRSGFKEAILLKVKRFEDDEALIVDTEEMCHNANEATQDALGHTKRSSHQDNMVPMNMLGAFVCESSKFTQRFNIGTGIGLTLDLRKQLWAIRASLPNKYIKYKYQSVGQKDKPRFPVYLGFRDPRDL